MILEILPGTKVENPAREQIVLALEQAYSGSVDAVILTADPTGFSYIQLAGGTQHIEYRDGVKSPVFAADEIPLAQCVDVFTNFAERDSQWKESVSWHTELTLDRTGKLRRAKKDAEKVDSSDYRAPEFITPNPLEPNRKLKPGRILLTIVLGIILTCGLCWLLVYLPTLLEPSHSNRLFAEIFFSVVWLSLGGIGWALLHSEYQGVRWSKKFLILLFCYALLFLICTLVISFTSMGWESFTFLTAFLAGLSTLYWLFRLINISSELERDFLEVPAKNVRVTLNSNNDGDYYGLSYEFLENYSGHIKIPYGKEDVYKKALVEKRLTIFVRYLSRDPNLHRDRVEILQVGTNNK